MARVFPALLLAVCALATTATGDDFTAPAQPLDYVAPASFYDQVRSGDMPNDAAAFVNDVNNAPPANIPATATGNGFGLGSPEERSAMDGYVAPQLVAPQMETLPEPLPQYEAAVASLTSNTVAVVAVPSEDRASTTADINQPAPIAVAAAAAPTEERASVETPPLPVAAAAAAPVEERAAATAAAVEQPLPVVAAAAPLEPAAEANVQPVAVAVAAPTVPVTTTTTAPTPVPTEATTVSKTTDFAATTASASTDSDNNSSGAHMATFFAVGAACALVVAGFLIARKRKSSGDRSPGTPKNTFFHVQSRLTPPPV